MRLNTIQLRHPSPMTVLAQKVMFRHIMAYLVSRLVRNIIHIMKIHILFLMSLRGQHIPGHQEHTVQRVQPLIHRRVLSLVP